MTQREWFRSTEVDPGFYWAVTDDGDVVPALAYVSHFSGDWRVATFDRDTFNCRTKCCVEGLTPYTTDKPDPPPIPPIDPNSLEPGLYRVFWKDGSSSLGLIKFWKTVKGFVPVSGEKIGMCAFVEEAKNVEAIEA